MVILFQLGEFVLFFIFIQLIIRLEESHQAILFPFYHCILFINRKVESSDQLSVFPGLVDVELVIEFSVTWQEINNQRHSAYKQQ